MLSQRLRRPAAFCVFAIALVLSSCSSNNKGKIEGKWKMVSGSKQDANMEQLKGMGVTMAFEFKPDGTFGVDLVPLDDKPESKAAAMMASTGLKGKEFTGKYTLASGDKVNFSGAKDMFNGKAATSNISITGDAMTMKDPDGTTLQLVRITATP